MPVETPTFEKEQALQEEQLEGIENIDELFRQIIEANFPDGLADYEIAPKKVAFERVVNNEIANGNLDFDSMEQEAFDEEFKTIVETLFEQPEFSEEESEPTSWFDDGKDDAVEPGNSFFSQPESRQDIESVPVDSEKVFVKVQKDRKTAGEIDGESVELSEAEEAIAEDINEVFSLSVGSDLSSTPETPSDDPTFDRLGRNMIDAMKAGSGANPNKADEALYEMRTNDKQAISQETYNAMSALNQLAKNLEDSDRAETELFLEEQVSNAIKETAKGEGMGLEGRAIYVGMAAQIAKRLIPGSGLHKKMIETAKYTIAEISEGTAFATAA